MSQSCRLQVRAVPNARSDEVIGWMGSDLRVKVRAPALDGRANEAVCRIVAERLGLHARAVRLVRGEKSRSKLIEVEGLDCAAVRLRLTPAQ